MWKADNAATRRGGFAVPWRIGAPAPADRLAAANRPAAASGRKIFGFSP